MTIRQLSCCVCGDDAGQHAQHWNRDTGFGICKSCVAWLRSRDTSETEIADLYGIEGLNFEAAQPQRWFRVAAEMARGATESCDLLAFNEGAAMARAARLRNVVRVVSATPAS